MIETQSAECQTACKQLWEAAYQASQNVAGMAKGSKKIDRRIRELTRYGNPADHITKRVIFYRGKHTAYLRYGHYGDNNPYAGIDMDMNSSYGNNPSADQALKEFLDMLIDVEKTKNFFDNIETIEKQRRGFIYHALFPLRCMSKALYYAGFIGIFIPPFFIISIIGAVIHPDKIERELMRQELEI
ncbi:MAG: hypothetical protein Q8O83_03345 [bacterium]|nr:hypothetical protein [bacterium]